MADRSSKPTPDGTDIAYAVRPDHTIELSDGRVIEPMGIVRNIHREPDRLPITAVERIGRRLSVSCAWTARGVTLTTAYAIYAEDERTWPHFSSETFPGAVVTIASDDPTLFRLPGGAIARFPYRTGFGVKQIDDDRFVVMGATGSGDAPKGDNIFMYDGAGRAMWRVGHFPSLASGVAYDYGYGVSVVRGELWGLAEKGPCARIDRRTGEILETGVPPRA